MTSRNMKIVNSLPDRRSKAAYMAGGRVTVGTIHQVDENTKWLKRWYVAKIRGITVSNDDKYKFETAFEARTFGDEMLLIYKDMAKTP